MGIMQGVSAERFAPDKLITRGEGAVFVLMYVAYMTWVVTGA